MIKRLIVFDFDGTLMDTPLPEEGKRMWSDFYKTEYPYIGWWSKKESLDLNVFNIKPFESTYDEYLKERQKLDTTIILMSNRVEKLRHEIKSVLNKNNVFVDKIDLNYNNDNKGQKLLGYIDKYPDVIEVVVYDDRESDLDSFENVRPVLEKRNINFIINKVFNLSENSINEIINKEINNFIRIYNKI